MDINVKEVNEVCIIFSEGYELKADEIINGN
jgi:hypothetical protein